MKVKTLELRGTVNRRTLPNFFTIARFGPDTLFIFGILSLLIGVLYFWGTWYLLSAVVIGLLVIFCVESIETISLSRAEYRHIVGAKCLVVQSATTEARGIVRLFTSDGKLESEMWSTEYSKSPVEEGKVAIVAGMKSVILEIDGENN